MLQLCQLPVGGGGGVPYFAQVSTTFVVYSVTNFKSKAGIKLTNIVGPT